MSLEEIYYIGQTFAVISIVGSLIVLIFQMMQANRLARESARRDQVEGLQQMSRGLYETPGLAEIWGRANANFDELTEAERIRFITYVTYTLRIWEGLHAQYTDGQLNPEMWDVHVKNLRDVQELNGSKKVLSLRSHIFSSAFCEFYERNMSDSDAKDIYGFNAKTLE